MLFVNPYNFIPIEEEAPSREKNEEKGTYTGVIHYSLCTKTPLFIPNTSNDDAFQIRVKDHKSYDFFSYQDLSSSQHSLKEKYLSQCLTLGKDSINVVYFCTLSFMNMKPVFLQSSLYSQA